MVVGRGLVVVEERRVGQVRWRVAGRLDVALRLLERRRPGVGGVSGQHLGAAVAQRMLVVALGWGGRKESGRKEGGERGRK